MEFNRQQEAAISHCTGPACILAGAGTGKTTVIAERFRRLVANGAAPERILVLTFSREAAEEMRGRITRGLTGGYPRLAVGTFHSFSLEHLTRQAVAEDRPAPTVVADGLRETLLAPLLAGLNPTYYDGLLARHYLPDALTFIDRAADELVPPAEYRRYLAALATGALPNPDGSALPVTADRLARLNDLLVAYERYQAELTRRNALDYGSMVSRLVALWRADPAARAAAAAAFDQIMVDEFQDANAAQFELVRLLAADHRQLVVVGDDDQAIYAFRGASDRFIRDFRDWYPDAPVYSLTENHRSQQRILDAANAAITPAHPAGDGRPLRAADAGEGEQPAFATLATQREEADWIADRIALLLEESAGRLHPRDCAVLCRSVRGFSEPLVAALARRGIPARTLTAGGQRSQAVADALAALRIVGRLAVEGAADALLPGDASTSAASDDADLLRVLASALPPDAFHDAVAGAAEAGRPLWRHVFPTVEPDTVVFYDSMAPESDSSPATPLAALVVSLRELVGRAPADQVYGVVLLASRWAGDSAQRSWPALRQLIGDAGDSLHAGETLAEFLTGYRPPVLPDTVDDAVAILTMHGAKGLQFAAVFIAGLSDGTFPAVTRLDPVFDFAPVRDWLDNGVYRPRTEGERQEAQLLEERRLFYVALTRAKRRLFLTGAANYGTAAAGISPFVEELLTAEVVTATDNAVRPSTADRISGAREYLLDLAARQVGDRPATLVRRSLDARSILQAAPGATDLVPNPQAEPFHGSLPVMSVSALETYRECPRQYFYGQCLRLPTETAVSMTFGNALHAALAQFNKHRRDHGALPPADRLVGWWRDRLSDNGYESRRQFSQALARGEQYLRRYHVWETQQEAVCPGRSVQLVEQSLKFTLDGYDFVCRVDALLRHGDGSYEIIDYKSGKRSLNKTIKTVSANSPDRSWQLGVYRLAWGAERPDATIRTTYCFLTHTDDSFGSPVDEFNARGENVISCIHSREALDLITGELRSAMEDIRANRFDAQPRTAQTCEYCQFGQLCEVSRHAYR